MSGKHKEDHEILRLLAVLIEMQRAQLRLSEHILERLPKRTYPATTGGSIEVTS